MENKDTFGGVLNSGESVALTKDPNARGLKVSIIFSTYNSPAWLEKVLWGYEHQTFRDFEIVIADDGSGEPTRKLIERYQQQSSIKIRHVWQEDDGFQKSSILNKAIEASSGDYLIFSDGDCIPRNDFVATHVQHAEPGCFLSGGYFKLPMATSTLITEQDVISGNAFHAKWLRAHGLAFTHKTIKLTPNRVLVALMDFITPTSPTWNGHNSSGWKKDLLAVNGFDETMQYGGQDRELGERLVNSKIFGKQIRHRAICIHLDHKRGYNTPDSIHKNHGIRKETRTQRKTWTANGIQKGAETRQS